MAKQTWKERYEAIMANGELDFDAKSAVHLDLVNERLDSEGLRREAEARHG